MKIKFIFFLLILCIYGRYSPTIYTSKPEFPHYEEVHISDISLGHQKRDVDSEEIVLSIKCFGKNVTLDLVKNRGLFSDKAKVSVYNGNNELLYSYDPPLNAYKEKTFDQFFSRITVFNFDQLKVKGVWSTDEDVFYIDPIEEHADSLKRDIPSSLTHIVYRESDYNIKRTPMDRKRDVLQTNTTGDFIPQVLAATSTSPPPSPCPQTVKGFYQSVAADFRYVNKNGGEAGARSTITNNWNTIQALYERTVNIRIMLDEIVLMTQASATTPEWNTATCPTIETMLSQLSSWRGTRNQNAGLWHLLTDCFPPPGTIGLAWVGVTCITAGGSYSGTGVSTHLAGMNGYRVSAHETGHNFAAQHEADGIMIAQLMTIDYFSQVTQSQMCQHIQSTTYRCYKDIVTTPTCVPQCTGKTCGPNGCGGTCGTCPSTSTCTTSGVCQATCVPNCSGRNCGPNGCGGSCGTCSSTSTCNSAGVCQATCVPNCSGKNCGPNGCGGTCGTCPTTSVCTTSGVCQGTCVPNCSGRNCGANGCGGTCGTCNSTSYCNIYSTCQCVRQCSGRNCGPDGCGGTCGTCPSYAVCGSYGVCQAACVPNCYGRNCGPNGCGGTCGTCPSYAVCNYYGVCQSSYASCIPNCNGRNCGPDGCGGTCGTCPLFTSCNTNIGICQTSWNITCIPQCNGKTCGPNGCGGTCGTCSNLNKCDVISGTCVRAAPLCVSQCDIKQCGDDGCGDFCGSCNSSEICSSGICKPDTSQTDEELLKEFILDSHNSIRLRNDLSPLTWSPKLANVANEWIEKCEYGNNRIAFAQNLGENIAVGDESSTLEQLYENWWVEELNYDCTKNRCFGPCTNYLQIISKEATEIGCAIKTCSSERGPASGYQNPIHPRKIFRGPSYPGSLGYAGTSFPGFSNAYPWFTGPSFPQYPKNPFAPNFPGSSTDYVSGSDVSNPFYPTPGYPGESVNQGSSNTNTKFWKYLVCNYSPKVSLFETISCDAKCTPNVTCESQGRVCGYIHDGCKPVYCGDCPIGGRCESDGLCKCVPFTNCNLSNSCGKIFDGCNWIDCQSECNKMSNDDVCIPTKQCPTSSDKQVCGTIFNGCEKIECGSCTSGQQCINFTCTNCSNCHMMAQCIDDTCKCLPGYIGDGKRCLPLSNTLTCSISDWKVVKGNIADWKIDYNFFDNRIEIINFGKAKNQNIISWINSDKLGQNSNLTFTVDIQPLEGAREWGIIFRQNGENYLKFSYKESGFMLSIIKENVVIKEQMISKSENWTKNTWKTISVISDGIYHRLFIDGYWTPEFKYWKVPDMKFGRVGLYADGPTNFRNVLLYTKTTITLKLFKCVDKHNFINLIRKILDIRSDQITDLSYNCNKKRDIASLASVTFSLLGGPMMSSTALTSQLIGKIASSHGSITSSIITAETPIIHSIDENQVSLISDISPITLDNQNLYIAIAVIGGIVLISAILLLLLLKKPKPVQPKEDKIRNIENEVHEMVVNMSTVENTSSSEMVKSKGVNVDPITRKETHLSISARFPPTQI